MRKLLLGLVLAGIVSISSCGKAGCTTCTFLTLKSEVCEDGITTYVGGVKTTEVALNGATVAEYAKGLEDAGYTCN